MKNEILQHEEFGSIRMKMCGGEPWFIAKDLCDALALKSSRDATRLLDENQKGVVSTDTLGGKQEMTVVNESGMYQLIFQSRKPEARRFVQWVTGEVLPSIRKYGFYSTDEKRIGRAERRLQKKAVKALLDEMRGYLGESDIKLVAKQCRVSDWHVRDVLGGHAWDAYLVSVLYTRATGNRLYSQQFYTLSGAKRMLEAMSEVHLKN